MLRAGTTSNDDLGMTTRTARLGLIAFALGCGGADSSVAPPPAQNQHFTIDVRYLTPLTAQQQGAVAAAVDKWTRALILDMGSFSLKTTASDCFVGEPALDELHHNLLLFISVDQVDGAHGVIAYTQVCGQRSGDFLPVVSHVRFDRADIDSLDIKGLFAGVIMHEMGHALGFNPKVYTKRGLASGGTLDPFFTGASARTEFAKVLPSYTGNAVPLEDLGQLGQQSSHWRWSVFGDELMIGSLVPGYRYPLSAVTLGLMRDIGYEVDMTAADPYPIYSIVAAAPPAFRLNLENDIVSAKPARIFSPVIYSRKNEVP